MYYTQANGLTDVEKNNQRSQFKKTFAQAKYLTH